MNRRLLIGVTFWLLLVLGVVGGSAWLVWDRHRAVQAQLDLIEPRLARMLGLANERPRLESTIIQARSMLGRHVYPAASDASQAGNDAQRRARDLLSKAGLEVQQSQVLPAKTVGRFERVPISVRLEGDLAALQAALAALPALEPTVFIDGIAINAAPVAKPGTAPRLSVQMDMFALRARE